MITEDYVSFEIAKLLKEKRFDDICDKIYKEHDSYLCPIEYCMNLKGEGYYLAPTLQMAMKWLREVHKIFIVISPISGKGYGAILCDVRDFDDFNYIGETDHFFHPEEAIEVKQQLSIHLKI